MMMMSEAVPIGAKSHFGQAATRDLATTCHRLLTACKRRDNSGDSFVNDEATAVEYLHNAMEAQMNHSFSSQDRECKFSARKRRGPSSSSNSN